MRNFSAILTRSAPRPRTVVLSAEPPIRSRRRAWLFWVFAVVFSLAAHVGVAGAIYAWPRDPDELFVHPPMPLLAELVLEVNEPQAPVEAPTAQQGDAPEAATVPDMDVADIVIEMPPEPTVAPLNEDVAANATPSAAALPDPEPVTAATPEQRQEAVVVPPIFARAPPMRVLSSILPFRDRSTIEGRIRAEWAREREARGLRGSPRVEFELEVNIALDGRMLYARVLNAPGLIRRAPNLAPWIESLLAAAQAAGPFPMSVVIAPNIVRIRDGRTEVVLWRFWLVAR